MGQGQSHGTRNQTPGWDPAAFGALLRGYRQAAGLLQEELAERAGLSGHTITNYERGAGHQPRKATADALAAALALSDQQRAAFEAAARGRGAAPPLPIHARSGAHQAARTHGSGPAFVGRTRELDALERRLAGEGPPVLVLAGEPGIGKSRLLRETAMQAAQQGWTVLEGGAQRHGGQDPYTPLLDALKRFIQGRSTEQLRTNLQGCAWLVRVLPELAAAPIEPLPPWSVAPEHERRFIAEAVDRFLANVAGPAGTLLLLDDLQWASPDALDLCDRLARRAADEARPQPLRLVGAYRDSETQPDDPLSVMLADLTHAELLTHLTLGPLAVQETESLLDGLLDREDDATAALRDQIMRRAGGVPFYVVSYVGALQSGASAAGATDDVPWSVAQSVRQRVAALSAGAREALGVAAVVGRVVPCDVLADAAERPQPEVVAALDETRRARLLEEEGAAAYRFAHDVIREVVESDLGAVRRTALHGRVAAALEAIAAGRDTADLPVEALAYHYSRSDAHEKAIFYLETAGDRARAQAALSAAEDYYRELADRLERAGRTADEARVAEKLGFVLHTHVMRRPWRCWSGPCGYVMRSETSRARGASRHG